MTPIADDIHRKWPLESARVSVPWTDVAQIVACVATFTGWTWTATGSYSWIVPGVFLMTCVAFYLAGTALLAGRKLREEFPGDFPLRLIAGYAVLNTALFLLAWVSPLSIQANSLLLLLATLVGFGLLRPTFERKLPVSAIAPLACCVLSLAGATLWAQDTLRPTATSGEVTVFKPWIDGFHHAAQIRIFAEAHGTSSIEDLRLAFFPASLYHYASYMTPALVKAFSGIPSYGAFAGILVPMGLFLTGLAAYSLVASWWGPWPGLLASVAVLLLPDAAHLGGRNTWFSYFWMQMVGPGGMYGVTLLALAWLFMLRGCSAAKPWLVALGWAVAAVAIVYKAQFFVASALLLWVFPPLFMHGLSRWKRITWLGASLTVFIASVAAAGRFSSIPLLRLDGSSTAEFLASSLGYAEAGLVKDFFLPFLGPTASGPERLGFGVPYLLLVSLGAFAIAYPLLAVWLRKRIALSLLILPALVQLNFLVMALGLAMDDRGIGAREELLHRPFVWVYFLTVAWVGGALGLASLGTKSHTARTRATALVACAALLLAFPFALGRGAQSLSTLRLSNLLVPTALLQVTEHLRNNANPGDLVQDSSYDRSFLVTALSERRPYVSVSWIPMSYAKDETERRVRMVERFKALTSEADVDLFAQQLGLRWFILAPGDRVSWPSSVLEHPVFAAGGYRLYRFD